MERKGTYKKDERVCKRLHSFEEQRHLSELDENNK